MYLRPRSGRDYFLTAYDRISGIFLLAITKKCDWTKQFNDLIITLVLFVFVIKPKEEAKFKFVPYSNTVLLLKLALTYYVMNGTETPKLIRSILMNNKTKKLTSSRNLFM